MKGSGLFFSKLGNHHLAGKCALFIIISVLFSKSLMAQFAPVVGFAGTTAIAGDSSAFQAWATKCTIYRGLRDISIPDSGFASFGDSSCAVGPAGMNGVVSLGDSGIAILQFDRPIADGPGFDFAVFENGFDVGPPGSGLAFLELAFVEVSTDGRKYVRFPCIDNFQDTMQLRLGGMDGSKLNNLAGKYIWDYGTPFDLSELQDSQGIDIQNINFVKVIDVIGAINPQFGTRDSRGVIINDPYPTNYSTGGFDLDAVGVINQKQTTGNQALEVENIYVYPNPVRDVIQLRYADLEPVNYIMTDIHGTVVRDGRFIHTDELWVDTLPPGVYTIKVICNSGALSKLIVKQ